MYSLLKRYDRLGVNIPTGGEAHPSSITSLYLTVFFHENPSWGFFLYHSVFLSTSYLLPSHTQLSDEGPFDEPFDCFATKKVCLTK